VIAGEGYERAELEGLIRRSGAEPWISLPGYVSEEQLIDLYRRAWVVASTSLREGWGMTVTEAAACGTPSVASRISGHQDAVVDGTTGILVDGHDELTGALDAVLRDQILRKRLGLAALEHASQFTWDVTARRALAALGSEALARP
jgi:glycosyltransferase involved in cell wall biosynthesis